MLGLRRRQFIRLLGGSAAWPLVAHAQQRERMRRIGVLLPATADDPQRQVWFGAFLQGLAQSDWIIDRNVQIDTRWATADVDAVRRHAANWPLSLLMSSWPQALPQWGRCYKQPARCRSCSQLSPIRLVPAS